MNAPSDPKQFRVQLKDPALFREQCYIDGAWAAAGSGQTIDVTNPATGAVSDPAGPSRGIDSESVYVDSGTMPVTKKRAPGPSRDFYSPLAEVDGQYRTGRGRPSEFRSSLRAAVAHLYKKIEAALEKIDDQETLMHLRELRAELGQVP